MCCCTQHAASRFVASDHLHRVGLVVWLKLPIRGQCGCYIGPESCVHIRPELSSWIMLHHHVNHIPSRKAPPCIENTTYLILLYPKYPDFPYSHCPFRIFQFRGMTSVRNALEGRYNNITPHMASLKVYLSARRSPSSTRERGTY